MLALQLVVADAASAFVVAAAAATVAEDVAAGVDFVAKDPADEEQSAA